MTKLKAYLSTAGLIGSSLYVMLVVTGCGDRRAPTDPNAFSAKTFFAEKDRWSGGSEGGP